MLFDESLNKVYAKDQLNLIRRFWEGSRNEMAARYFGNFGTFRRKTKRHWLSIHYLAFCLLGALLNSLFRSNLASYGVKSTRSTKNSSYYWCGLRWSKHLNYRPLCRLQLISYFYRTIRCQVDCSSILNKLIFYEMGCPTRTNSLFRLPQGLDQQLYPNVHKMA